MKIRIVKTTHGKIPNGRLFWLSRYLAKKAGSKMRAFTPNGSYVKHPKSGRRKEEVVFVREGKMKKSKIVKTKFGKVRIKERFWIMPRWVGLSCVAKTKTKEGYYRLWNGLVDEKISPLKFVYIQVRAK